MSTRTTPKASPKRGARSPAKSDGATRAPARGKSKPAAEQSDGAEVWTLRLYVTGRGERSERALSNLQRLCEANLAAGSYHIEVIDLLKNPELARDDQILAIPTLVRKLPEPMKRIIGDLSNADRALLSLDFPKLKDPAARP